MPMDAGAAIQNTLATFIAAPDSIHEQLSRVDFVCRVAFALAAPAALADPEFQLSMRPNPGLGTLREGLGAVQRSASRPFSDCAQAALTLLSTRLPASDPSLQSIEALRNHLFHGGSAPRSIGDVSIAATIFDAIRLASESIEKSISGATLRIIEEAASPLRVFLDLSGSSFSISPLIAISPETGSILVFSRITTKAIVLNAAQHDLRHLIPRSDYEVVIRRFFKGDAVSSMAADLAQATIEDVEGFQEPGSLVRYSHEPGGVIIDWVHADGSNRVERKDQLRIGPNNTWQWFDGNNWLGYTDLLKRLANWRTLTQRMASILRERLAEAKGSENRFVPMPGGVEAPFIPTSIRVGQFGSDKSTFDLAAFRERLDGDVQANRGVTHLYFVHAEAGAGKTTTLLRMAADRSESLSDETQQEPLFLYVSARGNVLEDLDKAIDATVAETRVLTSAGVRALCRNGLIVPIVDGFDELVGSPTYSDALASLRPWLKALGGRGVLVVSARSSYFVSLYNESIRRETNRDINVRHFIAELDRWTAEQRDNYLEQCGVPLEQVRQLPSGEQDMLRLPFFARASIGPLLGPDGPPEDLLASLMNGYVDREHAKIEGPTGEKLISVQMLKDMFEELAAWMMEQSTREVAWADFLLIAEVSLTSDLSDELANRLAALCGLDVSEGRDRRFRFSHEVFLDFFFGSRVGRALCGLANYRAVQILSRAQLTSGSARTAWRVCHLSPEVLDDVSGDPLPSRARPESPMASNAGLLWAEAARSAGALNSASIRHARFATLDLRAVELTNVVFQDCAFELLLLGSGGVKSVEFRRCEVQELSIENGAGIKFNDCLIDVATSAQAYGEDPDEILDVLEKSGAQVITSRHSSKEADHKIIDRARFFLGKIHSRVAMSIIILDSTHLPEDDTRFRWITRNDNQWKSFVRALIDFDLATLEPINASGQAKVRVRFAVPPADILHSDGSVNRVARFWKALSAGDYS